MNHNKKHMNHDTGNNGGHRMPHQLKEEKQLGVLLKILTVFYLLLSAAFIFIPSKLAEGINALSERVVPGLEKIPTEISGSWLPLVISFMLTAAALCYFARRNVRKNRSAIITLLIAHLAASISAMSIYFHSSRYFTNLLLFSLGGLIFILLLIFFLRANKVFFETQIFIFRKKQTPPPGTGPATVVALKGDDKLKLLDDVLEQTGFFGILEKRFKDSGKTKENFKVIVKPNFMFLHHKKDYSSYTDPEMVEHLIDRIYEKGFTDITVVEAQSTYGNYFKNREVLKVAEYVGYSTKKNYKIVDLTEEKVPFDYGGRLGKHVVGPTWRDGDFRISFAKNKTHVFCNYTLTLKNIYGTLPMQNKLKEYHAKREYDWPTIESMKHFPVHFGLVDAFYSADGQFGVTTDPKPNFTKTVIGGENLMAVDWVGAKKMGLDPDKSNCGRYLQLAIEAFGRPEVVWKGDHSVYEPWENVSEILIQSIDVIEESYSFSNWMFSNFFAMDGYFALKKRTFAITFMRRLLKPIKRLLFKYDYLD